MCALVGASVCPVHCGKMADRIQMPFGIIGRTGPGMRHVVGFGDRSTGRGTFGGEFGARHCNQWGLVIIVTIGMHRCGISKMLPGPGRQYNINLVMEIKWKKKNV